MRSWGTIKLLAIAWPLCAPSISRAAVDLVLRAEPQAVAPGEVVNVGLYAVSEEGTEFGGMDVLLAWDPTILELRGATDSQSWLLSGFKSDVNLDGLNADCGPASYCEPFTALPYNDGDAMYQIIPCLCPGDPMNATSEGVLLTTFQFAVLSRVSKTHVSMPTALGQYSQTRVLLEGASVTGNLVDASVTIASASLSASDVYMPAGSKAEILVSGDIAGPETIGVTLLVEISSRKGNAGGVIFTQAPPVDIEQIGDPWPLSGTFDAFDTDFVGFSETLNGSTDDNGSLLGDPLTYSGPLSSFPIISSVDAAGIWDITLCQGVCKGESASSWWHLDPVPTTLRHATVRIVSFGDGNADDSIDMQDYAGLLHCFTGSTGPADPVLYSRNPGDRCVVYDFDRNGAINADDYAAFFDVMSGP